VENIVSYYCPGAFELPMLANKIVFQKKFDAVICLGTVIRGETDHYEHICRAATDGIAKVALNSEIPVLFGVLTCKNISQAKDRSGQNENNKGFETALAALQMIDAFEKIQRSG